MPNNREKESASGEKDSKKKKEAREPIPSASNPGRSAPRFEVGAATRSAEDRRSAPIFSRSFVQAQRYKSRVGVSEGLRSPRDCGLLRSDEQPLRPDNYLSRSTIYVAVNGHSGKNVTVY